MWFGVICLAVWGTVYHSNPSTIPETALPNQIRPYPTLPYEGGLECFKGGLGVLGALGCFGVFLWTRQYSGIILIYKSTIRFKRERGVVIDCQPDYVGRAPDPEKGRGFKSCIGHSFPS